MKITHAPTVTKRTGPQHFHTKSWSDRFECPTCGASRRVNLNFLGARRVMVCDGVKITRSERLSLDAYRAAIGVTESK